MKALGYEQTKILLALVLKQSRDKKIREDLYRYLNRINSNEGQFYAGIVKHGPHMKLTSEQWFELLSCLRTKMLRSELSLGKILSPRQIKKLPPPIG